MSPIPEDLELHLSRVGCLDLVVKPIKFMLDAVLGGGVQHLSTDAGRCWGPGNEENLAFLHILPSNKVKIIQGISAVIFWERCQKIIITLSCSSCLLHNDLLLLFLDFEDNITKCFLHLELKECLPDIRSNTHPRGCIGGGAHEGHRDGAEEGGRAPPLRSHAVADVDEDDGEKKIIPLLCLCFLPFSSFPGAPRSHEPGEAKQKKQLKELLNRH